MILKRLKLKNYRQHKDLTVEFKGNLILVTGDNGKGKSNLMGAIQFALTGEQAGVKKEQLLSWGTDESGQVELWFEHDGKEAYVFRALHSNTAILEIGDEAPVKGITQVNSLMQIQFGIDKDLMRQAIFVKQGELDEALFTDPRVREMAFQRLLGISDSVKIHKTLTEVLAELGAATDLDAQIESAKSMYAERHTRLTELRKQHAGMLEQQSKVASVDQLTKCISDKQSQRVTWTTLRTLLKATNDAKAAMVAADSSLAALPTTTVDIQALDAQLTAINQQIAEIQHWQNVVSEWSMAGQALMALGDAPYTQLQLAELEKEWTAACSETDKLAGKIALHTGLHKSLCASVAKGDLTSSTCPVCGSDIADIAALVIRLDSIVKQLTAIHQTEASKVSKAKLAYETAKQAQAMYAHNFEIKSSLFNKADAAVKSLKPIVGSLDELVQHKKEIETKRNQAYTLLTSVTSCRTRLDMETKRFKQAQANLDAAVLSSQLPSAPSDDSCIAEMARLESEIQELHKAVNAVQSFNMQLSALGGMIQETSSALKTLDGSIAILEQKKSQQSTKKEVVETLSRVRDWFHYSNGPRTLTSSVLSEMNDDVNKFLSNFTAPFTVIPAEDGFGFRCLFTDGRDTPKDCPPDASVLSGGEKVQLAVAFRLSSYCMFANKLGLLSLDEPTCYLDAANIGRFCDLMQLIKKIARDLNIQVIMATHEESLIPFADTVINLNKKV